MSVLTYNPKQVTLSLGAKTMTGFMDGTFILAERNDQAFHLKVGSDGEGARAKSADQSGKVTLTLLQTSPSNDDLSAFANADELSGAGEFPLLLRDASGRTLMSAVTAWIQKFANTEFAKEVVGRQWVIETDQLLIANIGGN